MSSLYCVTDILLIFYLNLSSLLFFFFSALDSFLPHISRESWELRLRKFTFCFIKTCCYWVAAGSSSLAMLIPSNLTDARNVFRFN